MYLSWGGSRGPPSLRMNPTPDYLTSYQGESRAYRCLEQLLAGEIPGLFEEKYRI